MLKIRNNIIQDNSIIYRTVSSAYKKADDYNTIGEEINTIEGLGDILFIKYSDITGRFIIFTTDDIHQYQISNDLTVSGNSEPKPHTSNSFINNIGNIITVIDIEDSIAKIWITSDFRNLVPSIITTNAVTIHSVALDPVHNYIFTIVETTTGVKLFRSVDIGVNWTEVLTISGYTNSGIITAMYEDPNGGFVSIDGYISTDRGASFTEGSPNYTISSDISYSIPNRNAVYKYHGTGITYNGSITHSTVSRLLREDIVSGSWEEIYTGTGISHLIYSWERRIFIANIIESNSSSYIAGSVDGYNWNRIYDISEKYCTGISYDGDNTLAVAINASTVEIIKI
jgi:hypothetical protein